jgi:alkylation response protein AidB-like acyl-CoA dehydrogenase
MTTTLDRSASFRQAVVGLVPDLKKRAGRAEEERRLPVESIADLQALGLARALVPRVHGGDERSLSEVLDAMTELATGCPSTAWVASLIAIHNLAACWLDARGQEEIFGDGPDVLIASSVAPTGTLRRAAGGFRLGGRWGFSSGVDHAAWIMLGANLERDADLPAEYFLCFVRARDVTMIDDWHVAGLRATGSKSLQLEDTFVPEHRSLLLRTVAEGTAPGLALHVNPLYHLPWRLVFHAAFPPAALGTAVGMLEGFREYTASRVNRFSGRGFRSNAASCMRMAEAAAQIDAARVLFLRDVAVLDRFVPDGRPLHPGTAERISYDAAYVIDACSRAVLRLFRGSGARALYESNPLQRHFRDIHAMTQHAAMELDGAGETYGEALFQNPAFAVGAVRAGRESAG